MTHPGNRPSLLARVREARAKGPGFKSELLPGQAERPRSSSSDSGFGEKGRGSCQGHARV